MLNCIKKYLLILSCFLVIFSSQTVNPAPFFINSEIYKQPDGTSFKISKWADEYGVYDITDFDIVVYIINDIYY